MEQSSHDLAQLSDEKEKQLQEAIKNQSTVEQEILLLRRQVIDLQGKIKDLEYSKCKATEVRQILASELRIIKSQYFSTRAENR